MPVFSDDSNFFFVFLQTRGEELPFLSAPQKEQKSMAIVSAKRRLLNIYIFSLFMKRKSVGVAGSTDSSKTLLLCLLSEVPLIHKENVLDSQKASAQPRKWKKPVRKPGAFQRCLLLPNYFPFLICFYTAAYWPLHKNCTPQFLHTLVTDELKSSRPHRALNVSALILYSNSWEHPGDLSLDFHKCLQKNSMDYICIGI